MPRQPTLRILWRPLGEDDNKMVDMILREGTEMLDTSDTLFTKVLTRPFVVKIPREIICTTDEWDNEQVDEDDIS